MEKFTSKEVTEANKLGEFVIDLLENHKETLIFYLSPSAVLDWFGRTVKGSKSIATYWKTKTERFEHRFGNASPIHNIGFRDTHIIKFPTSTSLSEIPNVSTTEDSEITPPNLYFSPPQKREFEEQGQGDGPHNNLDAPESPVKKCKLDLGQGDGASITPPQLKYIRFEGSLEFRTKSTKKLQAETKWNRPCKLEVAYSATNITDCTIYMIIYHGNTKCRRNLLKDFESCKTE